MTTPILNSTRNPQFAFRNLLPSALVLCLAFAWVLLLSAPGFSSDTFISPVYNPALLAAAPAPGNETTDGDPVDLGTGLFVYRKTDLFVPDVIPLVLTRTYRQNDFEFRNFGQGSPNPYELLLVGNTSCEALDLVLPDGGNIHYTRIAGSNCDTAVLEHTTSPTRFFKSTLSYYAAGERWNLKLKDGTVYQFPFMSTGTGHSAYLLGAMQDRNGNQLTLTRDPNANQRITRITSPNGRWIEFTYDPSVAVTAWNLPFAHRILQAQDHTGRAVTYTYVSGRLMTVTDPNGGITEYTYDSGQRMRTIKDARGIVYLTNQYDANGRVYSQTQADGGVFYFSYVLNSAAKVTTAYVYDPRVALRQVTFNTAGYTTSDTRALYLTEQQTLTYERQAGTNFVLSVTDAPLNRTTAYTYDSKGNVLSLTRLAGTASAVTTTFAYEPTFNQIQTLTDPELHTTSFTYDSKGNLIVLADPRMKYTTLAYNGDGQPLAIANHLSHLTSFAYNASGDLIAVTDPLGNTTTRGIDSAGRLISLTAPLKQKTTYDYDPLNRLKKITDPLNGKTEFTHDPNGNLLSVKDARNGMTGYTYDSMDRLVTRTDPVGKSESYQYDLNGNLIRFTDRKGQATTFVYDGLNRRTKATYHDASTTTYTYDGGNRLTQANDALSGAVLWSYDGLDRVLAEGTNQEIVYYTYDKAGRRKSMVQTITGQTLNYHYDNADRLTSLTQGASMVSFGYDDANRRTMLTLPNGVRLDYAYDNASRLTGLTYKLGATTLGNLSYGYDANGQRTNVGGSFARTNLPAPVSAATYDLANRMLTFDGFPLTSDFNGNLLSLDGDTYTWNVRNQLTGIAGAGLSASFSYDALGRRLTKTVNGQGRTFAYDGVTA
ncbi:MAG: DUF6531 domain-containing protein, partial [Candidatus Binatia bacterium]